jgi:NADP-dependent 3-hydroxy acid dehydrogenase YdfG
MGFDIESNYDLVFNTIINNDPDIFINNAYAPKYQNLLLETVYDKWKLKNKLIINIGSIAALVPEDNPDYNSVYATDKRNQKKFIENENFLYSKKNFNIIKCGLININCDYVSTPFKSKYDKRKFPNLDPKEVANIILFAIESFNNNICIREINIHSTKRPIL